MNLFKLTILVFLWLAQGFVVEVEAGSWFGDGDIQIEVVSDRGRTFSQYEARHGSYGDIYRSYLEAVPGKSYSLRIRNRTGRRIGVVIAVDGRNIISGDHSELSRHERMYVLGPYQEAVYEGWRTGWNRVNEFYFSDAEQSYAAAWGDYSAMGVIAAAVYKEKKRPAIRKKESPSGSDKRSRRHGKPGTGFGEEQWSPAREVRFHPRKKASSKYFIKYEWRRTLCRRGIIACVPGGNRFWPYENSRHFAPPPPSYREW